jgi:hypothetical protein
MKTPGKLIYDFLISFVDDQTFNFHWVKDLFEYLKTTGYLQDDLKKTKLAELLSQYVDSSTSWTAAAAKERLELFNLQPVKEVLLNRLYMLSWYYQGKEGEGVARAFYEKIIGEIKQNNNIPFKCPYQIGFIHSSVDEHWAVAVLVRGGAEEGNDTKQNDRLYSWFNTCHADSSGTEKNTLRVTHPSIEEIIQNRYGTHYTCIENYESQ